MSGDVNDVEGVEVVVVFVAESGSGELAVGNPYTVRVDVCELGREELGDCHGDVPFSDVLLTINILRLCRPNVNEVFRLHTVSIISGSGTQPASSGEPPEKSAYGSARCLALARGQKRDRTRGQSAFTNLLFLLLDSNSRNKLWG